MHCCFELNVYSNYYSELDPISLRIAFGLIEVSWDMLKNGKISWKSTLPEIYEQPTLMQKAYGKLVGKLDRLTNNWKDIYIQTNQEELLKTYTGSVFNALHNPQDLSAGTGFKMFIDSFKNAIGSKPVQWALKNSKQDIVSNLRTKLEKNIRCMDGQHCGRF